MLELIILFTKSNAGFGMIIKFYLRVSFKKIKSCWVMWLCDSRRMIQRKITIQLWHKHQINSSLWSMKMVIITDDITVRWLTGSDQDINDKRWRHQFYKLYSLFESINVCWIHILNSIENYFYTLYMRTKENFVTLSLEL